MVLFLFLFFCYVSIGGGEFLADKFVGTCPCGFTYTTPHGEDDAVTIMQNHVKRIHPDDYPNGLTRKQAMEHIKKA